MPSSYSLTAESGVILETWFGDVSIEDIEKLWRDYLADPEVMAIRTTLADMRQAYERLRRENEILHILVRGNADIAAGVGHDADEVMAEARALLSGGEA
jgi:hypothetical protein